MEGGVEGVETDTGVAGGVEGGVEGGAYGGMEGGGAGGVEGGVKGGAYGGRDGGGDGGNGEVSGGNDGGKGYRARGRNCRMLLLPISVTSTSMPLGVTAMPVGVLKVAMSEPPSTAELTPVPAIVVTSRELTST